MLFERYFDDLIELMKTLNVSIIPTRNQLFKQFQKRACYGAFFSLFSVPMRLLKNADNDAIKKFLSDSTEGEEFRRKLYSNDMAQRQLGNLLMYFNENKFLD